MEIKDIKTPFQVYDYIRENIRYGWIDINGEKHINSMHNIKNIYRTMSLEEILTNKIGTCLEQTYLTHILLDEIGIPNKMYCSRTNVIRDEIHCFVLFYWNGFIGHLEHANEKTAGVYPYEDEVTAIEDINAYYINTLKSKDRIVTEFYDLTPGMTYEEFNMHLRDLDKEKVKQL